MVTRSGFVSRLLVVANIGALCLCAGAAERRNGPADSGPSRDAGLIRYDIPGGESIFALSLKGAAPQDKSAPHDHVVLFDTSASQAGGHRQQGLAVVTALLASLGSSDRVQLFAADVQIKALSNGFFAPQSAETKVALAELKRRVPLGATSLQPALETALNAAADSSARDRARSIIYIGDGMSTGKLVDRQEFRSLISQLRTKRIPFSSFAVGPRTDLQVLGVLAHQTGGVVLVDALVDDASLSAEKLGKKLATAADAVVLYPETISLAPQADKLAAALSPGDLPPIRSDRETILLGKGRLGDLLKV
ncbi:MAG TPA: VWA domain-containing protein, partial [Planctomycetaceae bacterium]